MNYKNVTQRSRTYLLLLSRKLFNWPPSGMPFHEKIRIILLYARARTPAIFVESGTLHGDTLAAVREEFGALHSIELLDSLYKAAVARFEDDSKIRIHRGDSGDVLSSVISTFSNPAVFWLDGHYSGSGTAKCGVSTRCSWVG